MAEKDRKAPKRHLISVYLMGIIIRNMYAVHNDTRIFMTPVLDYDSKAKTCVLAVDGAERVFQDEKELIRYLAFHTDTHGYADPSRWSNSLILRQFSNGRAARTWSVEKRRFSPTFRVWVDLKTENWDLWFHDANGRTIDVRDDWPDVIAAVRCGDTTLGTRSVWQGRHFTWKKRHSSCFGGRKGCAGALARAAAEEEYEDDEGRLLYRWKPRGKLKDILLVVGDFDFLHDGRSRHSTGWKEHKYKHQWEHRVREQEKHLKSRARKAARRKTETAGEEGIG